jgi:PIN domain nuclease of toxin-antitoxin system
MSEYLLDTAVFLLSLGPAEQLNANAREILGGSDNKLWLSAASPWEISIKWNRGKLNLPKPPSIYVPERLRSHSISTLSINHYHGLTAGELPRHHDDPFDRMLIAQAISENLVLMTTDRQFEKYKVETFWCGR